MNYLNERNHPSLMSVDGHIAAVQNYRCELKTTRSLNARNGQSIRTSHTHATSSEASPLMSRNEAADYIGVRPQTLASWACNGRYGLPMVKIGRYAKYRKIDLDRFIESNVQGGEVLQ